ncbi:MAG: hypothetical protein ABIE94_07290 [archaeon]
MGGSIAIPLLVKAHLEYAHSKRTELQEGFGPVISTLNSYTSSAQIRDAEELYSLRHKIAGLHEVVSGPSQISAIEDAVVSLSGLAHDTAQGLATNYETTTALVEVRDQLGSLWGERNSAENCAPICSTMLGAVLMVTCLSMARYKVKEIYRGLQNKRKGDKK